MTRTSILMTWAAALSSSFAGAGAEPVSKPKTEHGLFMTEGARRTAPPKRTELAVFAAGCFWGVEQEFRKLDGVVGTAVGYTGGHTGSPTYEAVCGGDTGHAEAVKIEFDPARIRYEELLSRFWQLHDPTTPNRQGPDVGDQYRSAIFYFSDAQKKAAIATRDRLQASGELDAPIVTEIRPAAEFTLAENYHQQYVERGGLASCHYRRKKN